MSGIYFNVEHYDIDAVRVSGAERFSAVSVVTDLLVASLQFSRLDIKNDPLLKLCSNSYLPKYEGRDTIYADVQEWMNIGDGYFRYKGDRVRTLDCALNTALMLGNDAIKLLARLHGQCELHTYVEEANRHWLAQIIEQGLAQNILRANMGWDAVITLLRDITHAPGPVATSYSATDGFPNSDLAGWDVSEDDELDGTGWYALPNSKQWQLCMDALRNRPMMEMKPEDWNTYRFSDGVTGFDIRAEANATS